MATGVITNSLVANVIVVLPGEASCYCMPSMIPGLYPPVSLAIIAPLRLAPHSQATDLVSNPLCLRETRFSSGTVGSDTQLSIFLPSAS
jgi:hypothetical protein